MSMKSQQNSFRFWLVLVVLLLAGGIINVWERAGEARVARSGKTDRINKMDKITNRSANSVNLVNPV